MTPQVSTGSIADTEFIDEGGIAQSTLWQRMSIPPTGEVQQVISVSAQGEQDPPLCNKIRADYLPGLRRLLDDLTAHGHAIQPDPIRREDFPPRPQYLPRPLSPQDDPLLRDELRRTDDLPANALRRAMGKIRGLPATAFRRPLRLVSDALVGVSGRRQAGPTAPPALIPNAYTSGSWRSPCNWITSSQPKNDERLAGQVAHPR